MKILFTNGRQVYPLFRGGDGVTIHNILEYFSKKKNEVYHIGKLDPLEQKLTVGDTLKALKKLNVKFQKDKSIINLQTDSYKKILVKKDDYIQYIETFILKNKPDFILTQLEDSEKIIKLSKKYKIKCIFLLHDHDPYNYQTMNLSKDLFHIAFNSNNTMEHYSHLAKCKFSVIYPSIKSEDYITDNNTKEFITVINPVKNKGAQIIDELIVRFPNEKFMLVKGWKSIETKNHGRPNVIVVDRTYDMRSIYSKTKILLIPSQWEEAFGRVAPEASINSIPIIASKVGGLNESVGKGGILIDEFTSISEWENALKKLLNSAVLYKTLSLNGRKYSKRFLFKNEIKKWEKLLSF